MVQTVLIFMTTKTVAAFALLEYMNYMEFTSQKKVFFLNLPKNH